MEMPSSSSRRRTRLAVSTAWAESPCTQMEPISVGSGVPDAVMMAPAFTMATTRAAASSGSAKTAPVWVRGAVREASV